jgi:hypothetical protein
MCVVCSVIVWCVEVWCVVCGVWCGGNGVGVGCVVYGGCGVVCGVWCV